MTTTLALALLGWLGVNADDFALQPGEFLPSLTLPTAEDGELLSTESTRGKKTLVHVFASW